MSHINQVLQDFHSRFPPTWCNTFNLTTSQIPNGVRVSFRQYLNSAKDVFFDGINRSILIGEYANEANFQAQLYSLKTFIGSIVVTQYPSSFGQRIIQESFNKDFRESINLIIESYTLLHDQLQYRLQKNANNKLAIKHKFQIENQIDRIKAPQTRQQVFFAFLNIKIAIYDISMRPTSEHIDFLNATIVDLQQTNYGSIFSQTLLLKCRYLFSKLILRGSIDDGDEQYAFSSGSLTIIDPRTYVSADFNDWFDYAENHYEVSTSWERVVKSNYKRDKSQTLSNLTFKQLHTRIKYYKDISKDYSALEQIESFLRQKINAGNLSLADSYITAVAYSYAVNNKFSLLLEDTSIKFDSVKEAHRKIINAHSHIGIDNFFADFKYFGYIIEKISTLTKRKSILKNLDEAQKLVKAAEALIDDYESRVQWCHENYNYVYLLPFSESNVTIQSSSFPIFIFSSFLLPLSKDKYEKDFDENKVKFNYYKASVDILDNVSSDLKLLQDQQSEYNKRESKSMEIIGIFTAIVTFVAGTLQSFKFINTPIQALFFMLAFGSALTFFIVLLIAVNRQKSAISTKIFLAVFVTIILSFWIWLASCYDLGEKSIKETKTSISDTLNSDTTKYKKFSKKLANEIDKISK